MASALFIGEGTSDRPLADLVVNLFLDRGVEVRMTVPDLAQVIPDVGHQTDRKIAAGLRLFQGTPNLLVVHRDADKIGAGVRRGEVADAASSCAPGVPLVPVVPIQATETWLLFDEASVRQVAGNPRGRCKLDLRHPSAAESEPAPKALLAGALATASETTGRRHRTVVKRFPENRRQLLERLDRNGPVSQLPAFQVLLRDVEAVAQGLCEVTEPFPVAA